MMSSSNVSLSTGSFQNQAATVDALETASVPKTDGVKRRKRDMSVLLEQASSSEGVSGEVACLSLGGQIHRLPPLPPPPRTHTHTCCLSVRISYLVTGVDA